MKNRFIIFGFLAALFLAAIIAFFALNDKSADSNTAPKEGTESPKVKSPTQKEKPATPNKKRDDFKFKRLVASLEGKWISRNAKPDRLLPGPCKIHTKTAGNDTDEPQQSTIYDEYDEDGKGFASYIDKDNDGIHDKALKFDLDDHGKVLSIVNDEGETIFANEFEYDERGNHIRTIRKGKGDEKDRLFEENVYDAGNMLIKRKNHYRDEIEEEKISYNSWGEISSVEHVRTGENGTEQWTTTYTYDDNINLISTVSKGARHQVVHYTYDENGNRTSESKDEDGDGVIDSKQEYEYDEYGNELKFISDDNGDGIPDRVTELGYECWNE